MAKQAGKIYVDPEIGDVMFRKSVRSRSIGIRVHPVKGVCVSVPYTVPYAAAHMFFMARRQWVLDTMARQRENYKDVSVLSEAQVESLRRQAKAELPPRLAELATRHGFVYNRVTIKNNVSNWGSCSAKGNINLNLRIMTLPRVLQDYVLLHELCHLRHQDHGHAFHLLLEHVCKNHLLQLMEETSFAEMDAVYSGWTEPDRIMAADIARKAAASKARYPMDHIFTRAIRQFRMI